MDESKTEKEAFNTKLLTFYDDFVMFHNDCSFICDALSCLVAEEDGLDNSTITGAGRFCYIIKNRLQVLKEDLKKIHEQAYNQ